MVLRFDEDMFMEIVRIVRSGVYVVVHIDRSTHSLNDFSSSIVAIGATIDKPISLHKASFPPVGDFMDRWLVKIKSLPSNGPALGLKWTMQDAISADAMLVHAYLWAAKDVKVNSKDTKWGLSRKDGRPIAGTELGKIEQDTSTPLGTAEIKGEADLTVTSKTLELKAVPPTIFI